MDGFFAQQLKSSSIPGATVSVVKDGEVLFAKGYGEADVEAEEPVVADETLFRIASTSKLFTSTAVMQLMEEGKLDLDRDVNAYLDDVEIPDTHPGRPVTLRHLLTHTAGFEESFTGSGARNAADVEPLGEYLSETPVRVRPPGEVTSYSNYGMSLAGHVVEEASGMTLARYVEENITGPLGMDGTTAAQPPASALRQELATGYEIEGGEPAAGPFEYIDEKRPWDLLVAEVEDDGRGGADPAGTGLKGLADRAVVLDGRLTVESPAGGPTRVHAELPWGSPRGGRDDG